MATKTNPSPRTVIATMEALLKEQEEKADMDQEALRFITINELIIEDPFPWRLLLTDYGRKYLEAYDEEEVE